MKIVVIGGSGLHRIEARDQPSPGGSRVVAASPALGRQHHHRRGAGRGACRTPRSSSTWRTRRRSRTRRCMEFFETSGRNLLAAEAAAGVGHHVALSVVGTDRLPASGYLRAKLAQERLIKASGIPYTIVRATQFFEFVGAHRPVEHRRADGPPVARPDAADRLGRRGGGTGRRRGRSTAERHGRGGRSRADPARRARRPASCEPTQDPRAVVTDVHARYFGVELNDRSLTADDGARLGATRFQDWLSRAAPQHRAA